MTSWSSVVIRVLFEFVKIEVLFIASTRLFFIAKQRSTTEALRGGGGGGGQIDPLLDVFGFKFLLLDRLSKALAQLFLVCEHIF